MSVKPPFVALVGAPHVGKTTMAEWLVERYGAKFEDDGRPLRRAIPELFEALGVYPTNCYTQEGKDKIIDVNGTSYTVRQLLGDVGNMIEEKYGQDILPYLAIKKIERSFGSNNLFHVFASCRKRQGEFYLKRGGIVVEIKRPDCESVNDFDRYEPRFVSHTIHNTGDLKDFQKRTFQLFDAIYGAPC
jgi:hypothetical protein